MRVQGTLVAPRLWTEEGVGRAKLDKHQKWAVLCLRQRREHPNPDLAQDGGMLSGLRQKKC